MRTTYYKTLLGLGLLCGIFFSQPSHAQSPVKGFRHLSRPEKAWIMAHPFIAKKSWRITKQARFATDSMEKAGVLSDGNGGQLDAFRHAYWMALLVQKIPARKAAQLGKAHEKGNYLEWKKGKREDGVYADSASCEMDLRNNASGIALGEKFKADTSASKGTLAELVLTEIREGKLAIVKKDAEGNALTCEGKIIDPAAFVRKWLLPKCLVPSNEVEIKR